MLIRPFGNTVISCLLVSVFFLFSSNPAVAHVIKTTVAGNPADYIGYNGITGKVYAVSSGSSTVQVFNSYSSASTTISLPNSGPLNAVVNQNNNKIYTRHYTSTGGVTIIDGATNATTYVNTGMNPSAIAINSTTNKVYVANSGSNTVSVIDGSTNIVTTNINVGSNPQAVAVDVSRNRIYIANATSNTVSVIDGGSDTAVTTPITVGTYPYRLAVNEITNRIYVANNSSNNVSIVDGTALSVSATVTVGTNPTSVGIDTLNNLAYIANSNSAFTSVIKGADNSVYSIPFNAVSFAINQATGLAYLANNNAPAVLPIANGSANSYSIFRPPVPINEIALDPGKNFAYLATTTGILVLDSNQYTLTTSTYSPDFGSGTVTANPTNTTYPAGTVVTLKATPALGSYFSGWSGDCTGNLSLTCKAIMDGAKTATANFTTTPPVVTTWSKSIGNPSTDDSFTAVQQTADGGYVMAGSYGYSGGVSRDFWVVKMNADGSVAWQQSYNGSYDSFGLNGNESASSIQQTADGGYILAGNTQINSGSRGWLLRLDSLGNHLWNRPIGADDASFSSFSSAQQTSDGGFITTGSANNNIWLVKITSTGVVEWQTGVLSGSGNSVVQTFDDGYIVAGGTLLTKFAADGSATWQSQLSGVTLTSVVQNLDGSYAVAGYSAVASAGGNDVWVAKLDATGSVITWQKSLGGSGNEYGISLQQTTDGGYIVGGYSDTLGAGAQDILLIKLDSTGALQGSHTYGGTSFDSGAAVQQTADGGFILVGQTYVGTAIYKNDGWAMKLDGTGMMTGCGTSAILTPVLTVADPGITIIQSAISSSNVTNKSAVIFTTSPVDTSLATATAAVCYITSFPIDGKLTVVPGNAQVELFWTPATSAVGITSYKVAKGINGFAMLTDCSTGVDVGNVTGYVDNTPSLVNDQKYYYRVCAVDAFSAVSAGLTASATPSASLNSLAVTKTGTGSGKISSIAGNIDCGAVCTNNYPAGAVVTLTAAPVASSYFNGWSGACAGVSSLTCQVTMAAALNVNADFTTTAPTAIPTWSKVLNSTGFDAAWAVRETADGGAIIAGEKNSAAWVIKLAASGAVQWQNTYGNAGYYRINEIQLTADGGYITAGTGNSASWIMKLAADGTVTWENNYIGVYPGEAYSVQQTTDGGYIFAGYLSPGISNIDALVVKLDSTGNVSWDKTYGISARGEYAYSIRQTADGGYIIGGKVESSLYMYDAWAMKLLADGSVDWQKRFNITSYYSQIKSIEPTGDGGYIAVGKNDLNAWIIKLNSFGSLQWQNTYNHFGNQGATSVVEAVDGSYVFATKGALINVSSDGANIVWQRDYAYINGDDLNSVQATADGGYIAVGASGGTIDSDIWLLKTGVNGFLSGWTRSITSTYSTTAVSPIDTTFTFAPAFLNKSISTSAITPHFMLTINKSGSGYGLVNSSETPRPEIDCGNICTTVYPANAAVSLNAAPFAASTFNGWSDAGCSGTGTCTFNISANTVISAPFTANNTAIVLNENFDSLTLPAGWTTSAASGNPWSSQASANSPMALNSARGGGGYVSADALSDSVLTSPQLDLTLYGSAALVFKTAGGGGSAYVEYSTDNGTTWTAAFTRNGSFTSGSTTQIVDLTPLAGSPNARFQLHFIGGDSNSWVIDDVQLYAVATQSYSITASASPSVGGSITPTGTTSVPSAGSLGYTITPFTGYHITDVRVDGISQGAITSYTFNNVTANHTIDAIFAINSADISGTISYSGSKTGRIYITLQPSGPTQPNNGMLGTSITAPGSFTIRGVPDGSYTVNAFMDSLDLGTQVQVSPNGTTAATVAGSNLTGLSITLSDPTPAAPAAPVNLTASPGNGSLLMDWDKQRNNGIEPADACDIYWGTSAGVSKVSNSGSRLNVPAGFDSPLVIDGLTNGDKLYFIVIAKSGGSESSVSAPIGPFTIGAPAGGYTVSGTLNYSGPPATGPLYIAIVNPMTKGAAGIFYTKVAAPSASNNFTVTGVPNGDYVIYSIIDMNNDGLFGIGDVMTPDNQTPAITVNGAALAGVTVALTGMNGEASITTDHNKPSSGPGEFFNVEGSVRGQLKRPVAVTLTAAPATIGIPLPMDLGLDGKDGSSNFRFWTGSSTRPAIGDVYSFTVTYADGTVDTTATASVTGVSDSFPANPQITTPVTTVPVFSWGPPATPPPTYSYSVWVGAVNSINVWDAWDLPSSINSITYGATGSSAQPLLIGSSYYWHVSTKDPKGNRASIGTNFVPANQGAPLIFWPAPAAIPLGAALSAVELNATASVPGTFSYSPVSGTVLAAGAQTLTVNFTPTDITNFTAATATVTLNVNPVITATAGSGGSINPAGVTMVISGGTQPYAITPTTGYHITDVSVDGVSQGAIPSYTFSSVTTNHTIDATFALDTFSISATASSGGTVSPAGTTVATYGSSQAYAITPSSGYHTVDVKIDGVSQGAIAAYTFSNIASGHTIDVIFAIDTFSITATANSGGTISPAGATTAPFGSNQAYGIAALIGYHIVDVKVDGVSQGVITAYTFSNVTANHTIDATFAIDAFTITATASVGGSMTPPGATITSYGSNQAYIITAATGYHVTDVKVDGVSQGAVTAYTFNNVTAGHTIDATFAVDTFTITATANSGGTITPLGATTLNYGASQSYTITPDAGFVLIDVRVDQASVGKLGSYTFNNVTSGHTIEAVFGADGVVDPANTTGVPQLGDALVVLTAALGDANLTPAQLKKVDTAPMINGVPQPDGKADLLDVLVMLRRVVGLEKW